MIEIIIEQIVKKKDDLPGEDLPVKSMRYILLANQILEMRLNNKELGCLFEYLIQERGGFAEKTHHEKVKVFS